VRLHYRDPPLLWLFVPAYLAHLTEELLAGPGFPAWLARIVGQPVPLGAFVAINAVALAALFAAVNGAVHSERRGWAAVAIATIALTNALAHLSGSIVTRTYSPGLVTGFVLYVPLGSLVLLRAGYQAPEGTMAMGVGAGLLIHAFVFVAAFVAARGI
jgi:Protein of unknown function with HXXEE motif